MDPYSDYETGTRKLLEQLGRGHIRYKEALVYQQRLAENLAQTREYGDTEGLRSERARILDRLGALSLAELGIEFYRLASGEVVAAGPGPAQGAAGKEPLRPVAEGISGKKGHVMDQRGNGDWVHILHISDIHRSPDAEIDNTVLSGRLLADIEDNYAKDNAGLGDGPPLGAPDLIIVSGDLTRRGEKEEFEEARAFLERLLARLHVERSRVILVPGNHEVNWDISAQSYSRHVPPKNRVELGKFEQELEREPLVREPYSPLIKRASNETYWKKDLETYPRRFRLFQEFFDNFYGGLVPAYTYPLDPAKMFTVYDLARPLGVVVVGFNSCDQVDAYRNPKKRDPKTRKPGKLEALDRRGFIHAGAIYAARSSLEPYRGREDLLRIAVFHHSLFPEKQKDEDYLHPRYLQDLNNAGFGLSLHGHAHKPGRDIFLEADGLPIIGAGSLAQPYDDRPQDVPRGYNLIVYNRRSGGVWVHQRREEGGKWVADRQREGGRPYYEVRPEGQWAGAAGAIENNRSQVGGMVTTMKDSSGDKASLIAEIHGLLRKGQLEDALKQLIDIGVVEDQVVLLTSRLNRVHSQVRQGIITDERADVEYARIIKAVLEILRDIH